MRIDSEVSLAAMSLAINLIVVGSLVAASVTAALKAAPALHPRARYIMGLVAFFIAALWPTFATFSHARAGQIRVPVPFAVPRQQTSQVATETGMGSKVRPLGRYEKLSGELPRQRVDAINGLAAWFNNNTPLVAGFFCLWIVVSAALLLRELVGHVRLVRRRRSWRAADARLRRAVNWQSEVALYSHTDDGAGPFTAGFFRTAVVIPEDLILNLSRRELRCIARHELAHARWRDPLVNTILRAVRAMLWPSLPLWYLERILRLEREAAADRAAVGNTWTSQRARLATDYAGLLLSVAKWEVAAAWQQRCGFISRIKGESDLEARVRRLLAAPSRFYILRISIACSLIFAGTLMTARLPLASGPVAASRTQHGDSDAASTTRRTLASSSQTTAHAERAHAGADAPQVYDSLIRERQGSGLDRTRRNMAAETTPDAPGVPPSQLSTQLDEQPVQGRASRENSPPRGALASEDPASINERMNREWTARQNEEAARELPARNAEWTAQQNAEAARSLPARNAAWTAEQNAAADRDLPLRNAELERELTDARNTAAPRTGPQKE